MQKLLVLSGILSLVFIAAQAQTNPILFSGYNCGATGADYYQAYRLGCTGSTGPTVDYNINEVGQVGIGHANAISLTPTDLLINTHGWPVAMYSPYHDIINAYDDNGATLLGVLNIGTSSNSAASIYLAANSNIAGSANLTINDAGGNLSSPLLAVSGSGAIGMGTSSPEAQLDINNSTYVSGSSLSYLLHVGDAAISRDYLTVANTGDVEVGVGILPTGYSTLAVKGNDGTMLDIFENSSVGILRFFGSDDLLRHAFYDDIGGTGNLVIWPGVFEGGNTFEIKGNEWVTKVAGIGVNPTGSTALDLKVTEQGNNQFGNAINIHESGATIWDGSIIFSEANGNDTRHIIYDNRRDSMLTIAPGVGGATLGWVNIDGNLLIGDPSWLHRSTSKASDNYQLIVGTGILTEMVKVAVQATADWSDFVFDKDYKLPTFKQLEDSITQNKHLPGIPGATEVCNNGLDLGKMDALLLQKIEELSLYVLELKKENQKQEKEISKLLKQNKEHD